MKLEGRWKARRALSVLLACTMLFSSVELPIFAAQPDADTAVSENNTDMLPEEPEEDTEAAAEDSTQAERVGIEADTETDENTDMGTDTEAETDLDPTAELLPIRIGQVRAGEKLPDPGDSELAYDLPISFDGAESLLLFVNYDIDMTAKEEKGRLVWSILRGVKGRETGSACLIGEEDDWIGFETVSASPYFTMTETGETESGGYGMVELVPADAAEDAVYDYYIRAAYYPGTEEESEIFYTAATVPFLPDGSTEEKGAPDDLTGTEEAPADTDDMEDAGQTESLPDGLADAEAGNAQTPEDMEVVPEDPEAGQTGEEFLPVSANNIMEENASVSENSLEQPESAEQIGEIKLYIKSEDNQEDEEVSGVLKMHPGQALQMTAKTIPEEMSTVIMWESGDENVAAVTESGLITAKAEGYARITAQCGDKTASAKVEVILSDANDKLVDLSGDIWVAGFEKDSEDFVYTGQKITQNIRVYHKQTLLKEKTDYTLSYKNNVNAAAYNAAKAPSVTINLKGQYSGSVTLFYAIKPLDINNIDPYHAIQGDQDGTDRCSPGYEQTANYSRNLAIPAPALTFGGKKLTMNKDFVCDYTTLPEDYKNGDSYDTEKIYTYTVNGTGNFTGSFPMQLVVLRDKSLNFGTASVKLGQKQYEYHGTALSKAEVAIEQLKLNGRVLEQRLYDYEVSADGIKGAYVTVYPSADGRAAGYRGCKKVNLKLVGDRKINDAAFGENWKESLPYSRKTVDKYGGIFQDKTGLLVYGEEKEPLREGEDYTVKYGNAAKAGRVTVTFTGQGRYKGTLKKQYVITPNSDRTNLKIVWGKNVTSEHGALTVTYQKGGAVPDFTIQDQDRNVLKIKTDYTVKYKGNRTPGTAMSCEITGKGNYKGYTETVQLQVTPGDIGLASISIPDQAYSTKQNAWKSAVTIKDLNGKKLAVGTDYDKQIEYSYKDMESGQPPEAGTIVTVTVRGSGCYENSTITGSYRIFRKNISELLIVIDPQEYTGEEITLIPHGDIHAYASNADKKDGMEVWQDCYEIMGYQNNIKAGTAKVTLHGIGDYGGTKTYSYKIQKKNYRINHVKGIKLNKTNLSLSMAEAEEKRTLIATLTAQNDRETIANPTVIWTTSDSKVVTVEEKIIDETTVAAVLTLRKEGSATITATAQDGNKKAQCKIKIVDAPLLKQAGQTIMGEAGQTAQLELIKTETQEVRESDIKWESNNSSVVTVEKDGLFGNLTMKKVGAAVIKVTYRGYVQQCYVVVKGEETLPEGRMLRYDRSEGCEDDTPYINKLLREWEQDYPDAYDYLYLPPGVYLIDAADGGYDQFGNYKFGGIILTDNQKLVMSPSTLLVTIGNARDHYHVIWAFGRDNISISGGQIMGERGEHKGKTGESGHGIHISGCTNVTIENVEISHCWGDGIYLGYYAEHKKFSNKVKITNCNLHHNRRSNLSLTDVSNVTIDSCKFNYASGTDPQYGINIEPNENKACEHVIIRNSEFKGNAKASMGIIKAANNVRLENCTLDGNFYNMAGKNVVLKNTTISGEVVDQAGGIRRE